jgi:hypothetical protein
MAEGFILDVSQSGARTVSTWVEGAPDKSLWLGVKIRGKVRHEIQTWRCGRCGYLESYSRG